MAEQLSRDRVRRLRLHAQRLSGAPCAGVEDAVRAVVGVQAQATRPSYLAVRARTSRTSLLDLQEATSSSTPSLVRSWLMRGTLHMVAAEDLVWLTSLLGPTTIRSDARRRAELDLGDATCDRALAVLPDVLTEPLSRSELVTRLREAGVDVSAEGQAAPHLLMYAACTGVVCRGPDLTGDEPSYVLVDRWLGAHARRPPLERDVALRELARRYLAGYGPAGVTDLARWSGLPVPDARRALGSLGDAAERVVCDGDDLFAPAGSLDAAGEPSSRLLGAFDTLLLGYRSRDLLVPSEHARKVQAGGMIAATVLVGGEVVGTWRTRRTAGGVTVAVMPFDRLSRGAVDDLDREAADLGRFLGERVDLVVGA